MLKQLSIPTVEFPKFKRGEIKKQGDSVQSPSLLTYVKDATNRKKVRRLNKRQEALINQAAGPKWGPILFNLIKQARDAKGGFVSPDWYSTQDPRDLLSRIQERTCTAEKAISQLLDVARRSLPVFLAAELTNTKNSTINTYEPAHEP
ncbi:MAG: hypothetical protein O2962_06700 [Cyanobacteria bacterium]|nr:hypothetical protein [Cyanobacteriota bacterium]